MTARIIADKIGYALENIRYSEDIYDFSANALIDVIKRLDDDVHKVMLVGHNPALTELAATGPYAVGVTTRTLPEGGAASPAI